MQNENEDKTPLQLYKITYLDEGVKYSDWRWLSIEEASDLANLPSRGEVESFREATADEADLYDEAYNDGYGIAMIQEFQSCDNGVTFRVEMDEENRGFFTTQKMFKCGICEKHKDFEEEVASANGLFLSVDKGDMLWHVCFGCAVLEVEVGMEDADNGPE